MLQTDRTISLPCDINDITSFAIRNCDFYFLSRNDCKLTKYCSNSQAIETICLERKYLCICYDCNENCYWAVPECDSYIIYRLNECFCEIGRIAMNSTCQHSAISICCSDCGNKLCISYPSRVAYVEKCSGITKWCKNENSQRINLGMIIDCQCQVNCFYEGCRQIMGIMSCCDNESIEVCIPAEYKIAGIASCSCNSNCNCIECRFCMLLSKICSYEFVLAEFCINFSRGIIDPCFPPPCPPPHYTPEPCPLPLHGDGIYEIMHSIALEEAGISHILNAEGEKIQKAVAMSDNIEQLVCVNESVRRTLTQVTLLEGMLYSKLEVLLNADCSCQNENPPCC